MEAQRIEHPPDMGPEALAAAMQPPTLSIDYQARPQFAGFHDRVERFACIVAHRRAGKTVACVHDLQRSALQSKKLRPRFAYLSPFLRQSRSRRLLATLSPNSSALSTMPSGPTRSKSF